MHIESEAAIVKNLVAFMNKFHFIKDPNVTNTEEIDQIAKTSNGRIVSFRSPDSYAKKI